jgi:eukaryotic-like serine/threonine-protein kinase
MTIYRLLHGRQWYSTLQTPRDVIRSGGFATSLPWLPHIPDRWRRMVRKMMHDDTQYRYQSADQVISALSKLPIDPDWACAVMGQEVRWTRETANRRIKVVWSRHSQKNNEWHAQSEPLGAGRHRTLARSNGIVNLAHRNDSRCAQHERKKYGGCNIVDEIPQHLKLDRLSRL